MTAASLSRFNTLAQKSDEAMNRGDGDSPDNPVPAVIAINGESYGSAGGVSAFLGGVRWTPREGGFIQIQELFLDIDKAILPDPPEKDSVFTFNGVDFTDAMIDGGHNPTDSSWHITANRTPK